VGMKSTSKNTGKNSEKNNPGHHTNKPPTQTFGRAVFLLYVTQKLKLFN